MVTDAEHESAPYRDSAVDPARTPHGDAAEPDCTGGPMAAVTRLTTLSACLPKRELDDRVYVVSPKELSQVTFETRSGQDLDAEAHVQPEVVAARTGMERRLDLLLGPSNQGPRVPSPMSGRGFRIGSVPTRRKTLSRSPEFSDSTVNVPVARSTNDDSDAGLPSIESFRSIEASDRRQPTRGLQYLRGVTMGRFVHPLHDWPSEPPPGYLRSASRPSSKDGYAMSRVLFRSTIAVRYHVTELPDGSVTSGEWDLRRREGDYLGGFDVQGMSVFRARARQRCLTYWMESQGAAVTSFEVGYDARFELPFRRSTDRTTTRRDDARRRTAQ